MQEDGNGAGTRTDGGAWRGYAQIVLVAVVLAAALYFARAPSFGDPAVESAAAISEPPTVAVVQPVVTDQALTVHLTGTVSLREQTAVMSETEGRIAWVSPDFIGGGSIAAGDPILRLDPTAHELDVTAAQAAVEAAEARVWIEEALGEANARTFARTSPNAEPSAWVRRLPHLALARAELKQAQAALAQAELRLARTEVSLPYDVRVVAASASVGEWASPDDSARSAVLGGVYRPEALQIRVPIEPRDLAYLDPAVGRAVRVTGRLGAWDGAIVRVSSVIDPTSRLGSVFIEFAADTEVDALPDPGTFVEIAIEGPAFANVFVLPHTVPREAGGLWVVREGRLARFVPEAHGETAGGWVVQAFDAGEGVLAGTLPGARDGLEVAAQAVAATD